MMVYDILEVKTHKITLNYIVLCKIIQEHKSRIICSKYIYQK